MRIATISLLALAAALPARARAQTERHVLKGAHPVIYDLVGEIRVEQGSGPDVVVEVTRAGSDAAQLQVKDSGSDLRIIFPSDRVVYSRLRYSNDEIQVQDDGTFGSDVRGGHHVRVSGSGGGLEAWADLRVLIPQGRAAEVHVGVGRMTATGVTGDLRLDALSGDVAVENLQGALTISSGSGDIDARGVKGDLTIETGSGDIEVNQAAGTRARLNTGSGDIRGGGLDYPTQDLGTGSGDITLDAVSADNVDVDTGSGEVELAFTRDLSSLHVETGSGDVTVRLPAETGAAVDISTSSGDLDTELPLTITRKEEDRVVGTIGDGKGTIRIDTGSGDVTLKRN